MPDYLFAPGNDAFRSSMRAFLLRRGPKMAPARQRVTNVQRLMAYIEADVPVDGTVEVVYLSAHGNARASMSIDLDDEATGETTSTRTDADEVVHAIDIGSVEIPARVVVDPTEVRIRGCRIGQSQKFLDLLRTAFGGTVPVVAPLHFNVAALLGGHSYEWFLHADHEVLSVAALPDRQAVLDEFTARNFTLIDGTTPVPAATWDAVFPPERWAGWTARGGGTRRAGITAGLGAVVGGRSTVPSLAEFRHHVEEYDFDWGTRIDPATPQEDIRSELAGGIRGEEYRPEHRFPVYERYGFESLQDFLDGFEWTPRNVRGGGSTVTGRRHIYIAASPVLDMTGTLMFNFQHASDAALAQVNVPETDVRIFARSTP